MADLAGVNGQRKEFKVVGKPNLPGVLSWAQATGVAKYGIDYVVPDMLEAKFLRSPHANARIKSVDTTKARAIPGVVDIVTWEDEDIKNPGGGGGGRGPSQGLLSDYAYQEGMEVGVIVVAENEDICQEALRALVVDWEVLPFVVDLREGRKPDAPVIRPTAPAKKAGTGGGPGGPGMGGGNNPPKKGNVSYSNVNDGDVEKGFKEADHIIEYDMKTSAFAGHIPNPLGTVAWWFDDPLHGEGKSLRIEGVPWGHDQVAGMNRVPANKVFQECMFVGGRYCDWGIRKTQQITPMLAKRTGRPVRCVNSRYDMYDFNLCDRYVHMKIGFKNNGLITAIDDFSIADGGEGISNFGNTMDQTYGPYRTTKCLNIKQNMEVVDSNRGRMYVSGQHNPMGWDTLMAGLYLIAEKLGKDPIEIATLNLHGPESQTDPNPVPSYEACVAAVKKMMNWTWHATGEKKLPDGRMHGQSFRYNQCPRHSVSGYNCKLELRNGVVHLPSKGPIIGHYGLEANAMVIAEELGLQYKDISIDLDHHEIYRPFGGGSDGSTASSWAMKECANKLKKLILETAVEEATNPPGAGGFMGSRGPAPKQAASPLKGRKPEELDLQDGKVVVKSDPSMGVPLGQAVRANLFATFSGRPPNALWAQQGRALDTMNVATCEVAVDTETGEVEILRFGVVTDTGKVMRQTSLEGQIHQVMDFTAGCQLQEEFIYDQKTGLRLSTNMFEYKKVSMLDMPRVDLELLETRAGNACYGSNGISHSLANTHLVIMAIHNAIGKWVESPATPDRVLKALGKA
jgi:CO/xanthine dehydrogenase Mo-binding subunit